MEAESYRLYLAIPCPAALRGRLLELQSQLEADTWSLKFSPPENFHLTLHFLGNTPSRVIDDLRREIGAVAHARRPFDLMATGIGAFHGWEDPHVVWAGVRDPSDKLSELHRATLRVLNAYRLFKLHEQYNPHITLARVKKISAAWDARRLQGLLEGTGDLGVYPVEELRLMRSRPGSDVPDEVIGAFSLRA